MDKCKLYCCLLLLCCNFKNRLLQKFVFKPVSRSYHFKESEMKSSTIQEASQSEQFSINFSKIYSSEEKIHRKTIVNRKTVVNQEKLDIVLYENPYRKWPINLEIDALFLQGPNGKIATVFIQPLAVETKLVMIHSHSNNPDIGCMMDEYIEICQTLNIAIIGYDYPGYGLSEGVTSEESIFSAINCIYHFALSLGYENSQIIVYGRSLGSGPTLNLASQVRLRGVILHSAFQSILRVVDSKISKVEQDIFLNFEMIKEVESPVLIIHGMLDKMVNVDQAKELSQQVQNLFALYILPDAGHNDFGSHIIQYYEQLQEFINKTTQ